MTSGAGVPEEALTFNGINGASGDYLLPPLAAKTLADIACDEKLDPEHLAELKEKYRKATEAHLGVVADVDPTDLGEAGWAVLFAHDADPAVREALAPLLEHRRATAGRKDERFYREYAGPTGYRPGESSADFLVRNGAAPGQPANPERVPYYVLLVGDPEQIPYRFQYQLDVIYAVGRVCFDTPAEYAAYAESVVRAETSGASPRRTATFFGASNPDDRATTMSAAHLVAPLAQKLAATVPDWDVRTLVAGDARKDRLSEVLAAEPPAFLFTASHGMGFPAADPRQREHQGALLCQDWPGPLEWRKAIPHDFYFAGDDLASTADVAGTIAFLFACYGAGTPKFDDFAREALGERAAIAPASFAARLPQRMLAHPRGGALAVVGHVERAWSYSFMWPRAGQQLDQFHSTLTQLVKGVPLGAAMEFFNNWYAALTTELEDVKENASYGAAIDAAAVSGVWTAKNDARNYVIFGDPAVRIARE